MAYNDDAVLARLSALNDSHDSIATAAQWIMFHRRHADRTVQLWVQRLRDSSASKRLSLIYLANALQHLSNMYALQEVAQQSRIRHKEDFILAFSPVIAEATAIAYKGAPSELQGKIRRVVDVWKDRTIFEVPIQEAIETRLGELDKARGTAKPAFGGSPFGGSSMPSEFAPLVSAHQSVAKLSGPLKATVSTADQEYEKQTDTSTPAPSAPVYAARLHGLLKTLASAEVAVAECVKAREDLITGLEKLLDTHRTSLEADKASASRLAERKSEIEKKKQVVELAIMQALSSSEQNGSPDEKGLDNQDTEPERPKMEALTPPKMEALTPPAMEALTPPSAEAAPLHADSSLETAPASTTTVPQQSLPIYFGESNKRRRIDDGEFPDLGNDDGIDADVAEMLK
ncbi:unnamed protein product [Clonostachys rhizophaga]|uniref:CID domain-containing protein n=1 Tax=Clonostachys rhizophaga TaxID=160324 RepID=A0A9N9V7T1_9HYPO|nr:unnamed protein product [Clonostachys rhizophaga]